MDEKIPLSENKHFCILPWIHFHVRPDANVHPCCNSDLSDVYDSLKTTSLPDIWNSEKFKLLRLNMLNNMPTSSCKQCYELEENGAVSKRMKLNRSFQNEFGEVEKTQTDGSILEPKMKYLDIRFSNACNFKCRGCSHALSSSWYEDSIKLHGPKANTSSLIRLKTDLPQFWSEFLKIIPDVEQLYFGGGEPLIMEEHYEILQRLIELKKTNVTLLYSTNLSRLSLVSQKLHGLWKEFKDVVLQVSIDDISSRAEYFRHGTIWNDILQNFESVKKESPHVTLSINCTINCFNAYYLPELILFFDSNKIVRLSAIGLTILVHPDYYSAQILPPQLKEQIKKRIGGTMTLMKLTLSEYDYALLNTQIKGFLSYMFAEDKSHLIPLFQKHTKILDQIRQESFNETYPELKDLHY
jgi:MoaA/NifB/PqqE/SkfB family radical SAM enzyme